MKYLWHIYRISMKYPWNSHEISITCPLYLYLISHQCLRVTVVAMLWREISLLELQLSTLHVERICDILTASRGKNSKKKVSQTQILAYWCWVCPDVGLLFAYQMLISWLAVGSFAGAWRLLIKKQPRGSGISPDVLHQHCGVWGLAPRRTQHMIVTSVGSVVNSCGMFADV